MESAGGSIPVCVTVGNESYTNCEISKEERNTFSKKYPSPKYPFHTHSEKRGAITDCRADGRGGEGAPSQLHTVPRCTMGDKPKQARVFRVFDGGEDDLAAEDVFDRLHNAEHPVKRKNRRPLQLKHVFSQIGSNTFLLDLDKATPDFVEKVVKHALGPHCSVERVTRSTQHETFLPAVERKAKEVKFSTAEREASTTAVGGCCARFILVDETQKVVYSYNDQERLERGVPEPRGAHVHAATPADTAQVRSVAHRENQVPR